MEPVNLAEFETAARERLDKGAFDYIAGGADDEVTLSENRAALERIKLKPRMLVDVSNVDTSASVLGQEVPCPVLLAPTAFQILAHPEGEIATARAAAATRTIMVVSTLASKSLEDIAAATSGPKWFQLYCYKDKAVTQALVESAAEHGYSAICMTVDVPKIGRRERDLRNRVQLPLDALPKNFERFVDLSVIPTAERESAIASYVNSLLDPSLTWKDVDWLRSITSLPVLIKGILTVEDACLAVQHEVEGIVVSNHGGRQLDGVPATIEVLSEVVEAVHGRAEVLVDGGIRRGTDVVKALALGARAVLIGRPYLWGLAVDGDVGVVRVLDMLREEVELALALTGCKTVADVKRSHVAPPER